MLLIFIYWKKIYKIRLTIYVYLFLDFTNQHHCDGCGKTFSRLANRRLHEQRCSSFIKKHPPITNYLQSVSQVGGASSTTKQIKLVKEAFNQKTKVYRRIFSPGEDVDISILNEFQNYITENVKYYFSVYMNYHQSNDLDDLTDPPITHRSQVFTFLRESSILEEQLKSATDQLLTAIEEFQKNGSGWIVNNYIHMDLGK